MNYKRTVLYLFFSATLLLYFHGIVHAQNPEPPAGQEWRCLTQESVMGTIDGPDPSVQQTNDYQWYVWTKATGSGLPARYTIVICTEATTGLECTTGDETTDVELPVPNRSSTPDILTIQGGPTRENEDSLEAYIRWNFKDPANYNSEIPERFLKYLHVEKKVFAVFPAVPEVSGTGNDDGLKQASLDMMKDGISKCVSLGWDPEGRVFDAVSLEPIPNVQITVLDKNKKFVSQITVDNPTTTKVNGQYAFYVAEGDFFLNIAVPSGYIFTDQLSTIHPNYTFAYKNIYKNNELIVERIDTPAERARGIPNVEQRDIALMPIDKNNPLKRPLEIISHAEYREEEQTIYMGKTSHPLTEITFKQGSEEIKTASADKNGAYETSLDDSLIQPGLPVQIIFTKVDLTTLKKSPLDSKTISIEPLLPYLEGYVYDKNGEISPSLEVSVVTTTSDVVMHTTRANEDGFFAMGSQYIPPFPYYLKFRDPIKGTSFQQSTSNFAKQNEAYLKRKNVNLMEQKKMSDKNEIKTGGSASKNNTMSGSDRSDMQSTSPQNVQNTSTPVQLQIIIIISIICILGLVGGIIFYVKSKKKTSSF